MRGQEERLARVEKCCDEIKLALGEGDMVNLMKSLGKFQYYMELLSQCDDLDYNLVGASMFDEANEVITNMVDQPLKLLCDLKDMIYTRSVNE